MKAIYCAALLVLILGGLLKVGGQTWTQNSAPSNYWNCVACSVDGIVVAAGAYQQLGTVSPGPLMLSTNSGTSWNLMSCGTNRWSSIAMSASGIKIFAVDDNQSYGCRVMVSTNMGFSWITNNLGTGSGQYKPNISCSADGTRLLLATYGALWSSTNSGTIWKTKTIPLQPWETQSWSATACSADGNIMIAVKTPESLNYIPPYAPNLFISTNGGSTWLLYSNPPIAGYLACSADGKTICEVMGSGASPHIFVSTNAGVNWSTNPQPLYAHGATVSTDGTKILVAGYGGWIRFSTNTGVNWITNDTVAGASGAAFYGGAMSADGMRLYLTCQAISTPNTNVNRIYTLQMTPSPSLTLNILHNTNSLSWIVPSTNFVLQQSADLANWLAVTNVPVLNLTNLQNQVALPASVDNSFFRLATP
jgi:hypothetical protein